MWQLAHHRACQIKGFHFYRKKNACSKLDGSIRACQVTSGQWQCQVESVSCRVKTGPCQPPSVLCRAKPHSCQSAPCRDLSDPCVSACPCHVSATLRGCFDFIPDGSAHSDRTQLPRPKLPKAKSSRVQVLQHVRNAFASSDAGLQRDWPSRAAGG